MARVPAQLHSTVQFRTPVHPIPAPASGALILLHPHRHRVAAKQGTRRVDQSARRQDAADQKEGKIPSHLTQESINK